MTMERVSVWKGCDAGRLEDIEAFCARYRTFISENKTERECVSSAIELARAAGYVSLDEAVASGTRLGAGSKVYASCQGKTLALFNVGSRPLTEGLNILGAHIDSPRIDIKQNPVFEKDGVALLDTHYYGGIKAAQWVAMPLAMHGVVAKKDGTVVRVRIGEDPSDPVFCISDILPHLGSEQSAKPYGKAIDAESLDVIVANRPAPDADGSDGNDKDPVAAAAVALLCERYGIEERDLLSAELEMVPAGPARDMGIDASMILGYGQDDRVCAYPSLVAQLDTPEVERTSVTLLVDKEEIGSVGATGMDGLFFENCVAEVMELAGEGGALALRRALARSRMLSSDVSAAIDPSFESLFEEKNAARLGSGLCFNKYTGSYGKSGSNDARAEYVALVRDVMEGAGVTYQTCELGKVNVGGGGTIAYFLARYGMDVIDSGVAVLSMHAPYEVASKADIFEAYRGYKAFLARA